MYVAFFVFLIVRFLDCDLTGNLGVIKVYKDPDGNCPVADGVEPIMYLTGTHAVAKHFESESSVLINPSDQCITVGSSSFDLQCNGGLKFLPYLTADCSGMANEPISYAGGGQQFYPTFTSSDCVLVELEVRKRRAYTYIPYQEYFPQCTYDLGLISNDYLHFIGLKDGTDRYDVRQLDYDGWFLDGECIDYITYIGGHGDGSLIATKVSDTTAKIEVFSKYSCPSEFLMYTVTLSKGEYAYTGPVERRAMTVAPVTFLGFGGNETASYCGEIPCDPEDDPEDDFGVKDNVTLISCLLCLLFLVF